MLSAAMLASDARLVTREGRNQIEGDPTEGALIVAAIKVGLNADDLNTQEPRVAEIPFTSERRRMTTLHSHGRRCDGLLEGGGRRRVAQLHQPVQVGQRVPLTDECRERVTRRRATHGQRRAARARGRAKGERLGRGRGTADDAARSRRDDGSSASRSEGRSPGLFGRRHPSDHDHGRSSADRQRRRAARSACSSDQRVVVGPRSRRDERRRTPARRRRHRACTHASRPPTSSAS